MLCLTLSLDSYSSSKIPLLSTAHSVSSRSLYSQKKKSDPACPIADSFCSLFTVNCSKLTVNVRNHLDERGTDVGRPNVSVDDVGHRTKVDIREFDDYLFFDGVFFKPPQNHFFCGPTENIFSIPRAITIINESHMVR